MKEENLKQPIITRPEIQKELYGFLTSKNKPYLSLPQSIRPQHPCKVIITIKLLLPLLSQAQVEAKPKELIIKHLIQMLEDSQGTVRELVYLFQEIQAQQSQQLRETLRNDTSIINVLSKLISLPTILTNLISDPKVSSMTISIREIQMAKSNLNLCILKATSKLKIEEKLIIINKLLVLKEQETVVKYFLKGNLDLFFSIFDHLSKQSNIVKYLYVQLLKETQNQSKIILKDVLQTLANKSTKFSSSILSLLNMNQFQYYSGQRYKLFYDIFYETNQKSQIIKDLLVWWAVSKNFIVTKVHAKVRCNLLAIIIQSLSKQELHSNDYIVSITEGIKKRLTDGQSKDYALLIWKVLGRKLELQLTEDIKNTQYFIIESQSKPSSNLISNTKKIDKEESKSNIIQQSHIQKPIIMPLQSPQKHDSSDQQEQISSETSDVIMIEPKNIYDCILGLRNPHRKDMALKKLPTIINKHKEDLVLMWNSLLRELLSPIKEQYTSILAQLFTMRPEQFIESVVSFFMNRQNNIGERTYLIQILKIGIDELSSIQEEKEQQQDQGFYFKKVKSRYFKQPQQVKGSNRQEPKTRRWGHTRIAYQNSLKGNVSLNFIKRQTAINKFYPVSNLLYFKIIDVLSLNLIDSLRQHQVYVHALLKLLAVFISNIKNHFDKYIILSDCSSHCAKIVQELIQNSKRENDRYEETGGITLMLALQILNKISLIVDKYVTDGIIDNLKHAIEGARKLPNYGMSSILSMIQSNIYQRVYMQEQQE